MTAPQSDFRSFVEFRGGNPLNIYALCYHSDRQFRVCLFLCLRTIFTNVLYLVSIFDRENG